MGNRLSQLGGVAGPAGHCSSPDNVVDAPEVTDDESSAGAAADVCSSTLSLVVSGEDHDEVEDGDLDSDMEVVGGLQNLGFAVSVKDVRINAAADTTTTSPTTPTRGSLSSTSSVGSGTPTTPTSSRPRICPILQNGRQVTKDFYWVLPERRGRLERQRSLQEAAPPSAAKSSSLSTDADTNSPEDVYQNMSPVSNTSRRTCRSESGGSGAPTSSVVRLVSTIRSDVPGVTVEECRLALSLHGWDVEKAARYLRVEQLFRLGLADREACLEMLEASGWSVEAAGAALVDRMDWSD